MVGTLIRRPLPPVSDFIRTLLDDANATAALATLGVVSGTYTPTLTGVANTDATTSYPVRYIRVGNIVVVSGRIDVDATAAGSTTTSVGISLPIASDLTSSTSECNGVFNLQGVAGLIAGDAANNRAQANYLSASTANAPGGLSFMYVVQ